MQILTPVGEAAFPFVFKPQKAMQEGKPDQYQLVLLYDQGDERLKKLEAAIEAVAVEKFGVKAKSMLAAGTLKSPLRSGDGRAEWMEGKMTVTARTTDKPDVVDRDLEDIIRPNDFYSGCRARMDIWLYAFDKAGNKGVAAILNNCQKVNDGERKSGSRPAKQAFSGAEIDEEEIEDQSLM